MPVTNLRRWLIIRVRALNLDPQLYRVFSQTIVQMRLLAMRAQIRLLLLVGKAMVSEITRVRVVLHFLLDILRSA